MFCIACTFCDRYNVNFTVYADELDGTVTDGDYVVDDSNTGDYTPPADTPVVDTPVVDDVPADDTGDYSDNTTTDTPMFPMTIPATMPTTIPTRIQTAVCRIML